MKTLEQILETGTRAEKCLAKISLENKTEPREIIKDTIFGNVVLGILGTGGLGISYFLLNQIETNSALAKNVLWGLLGGVVGLASLALEIGDAIWIKDTIKAVRYYNNPKLYNKIIPKENEAFFYIHNKKITAEPTPVEIILGERVYTPRYLNDCSVDDDKKYVFLRKVKLLDKNEYVRMVKEKVADYEHGSAYETVAKHSYKIKLKHVNTTFYMNGETKIPEYWKNIEEESYFSAIFVMGRNGVNNVEMIFDKVE